MYGGEQMEYTVNITWDNEAEVWVATSEDILGLVMESDSHEMLINRLKISIPELLELNCQPKMSLLKCISVKQQVFVTG